MITFARFAFTLGMAFLLIGLLRTSENSWIYAHVSGSVFVAVLGGTYLASHILIRRKP